MATRKLQVVLDLDTGNYSGRLSAAGSQMRSFGGHVGSTNRHVRDMGTAFNRLGSQINAPRAVLRDYVLILGNIRLAILNIRDVAIGWVSSLVQQSAQVERLTILMEGLSKASTQVGRSKEAQQNLRQLFDLARNTGFEVSALSDSFVKFKSGGLDPTDGSLKSLANAVAFFGGTSDTMHRASIAIQQMAGKGVISMEELRQQLGEAVPTAMMDMARAMGMTVAEFTKQVSKGKVQAKPALEAMFREFEAMYSGAGQRMASTLTGQLAEFRTNVTELSTVFTGMGQGDEHTGIFKGTIDALREVNLAMKTGEGRAAVQELGQAVNSVMQSLIGVGQFIVKWRSEIGTAVGALATGFIALKTINIAKWFVELGASSVAALRSMGDQARIGTGRIAQMSSAIDQWSMSLQRQVGTAQLNARYTQQEIAQNNQLLQSLSRKADNMRALEAASRQKIATAQQDLAVARRELNLANAAHQANVNNGRAAVESANRVAQAQAKVQAATTAVTRARTLSSTASAAAVAAEERLNVTTTAQSAAQARLTVATAASTTAKRAMATASALAATAVRGLGIAVNLALGPLGAIATALAFAAYQAGIFENRANRAARAAADMMKAINVAENYKNVSARANDLSEDIARDRKTLKAEDLRADIRDETAARLARNERELASLKPKLEKGRLIVAAQEGRDYGQGILAQRDVLMSQASDEYRQKVDANAKLGLSQSELAKRNQADLAAFQAKKAGIQQKPIEYLQSRLNGLDKDSDAAVGIRAMIDTIKSGVEPTNELSDATGKLGTALNGAGTGAGSTNKKLTDAEKAAKKAATEFQNAREKYGDQIARQAGDVAELKAQLDGGDTALAQFQARLKNGLFDDATPEELAKLAAGFAEIDRLNREIDFKRTFDRLHKDVAKATTEADQLWSSLQGGTYEVDQRLAQIRSRFAGMLEGIQDPEKLKQMREEIDRIVAAVQRADAADVARGWQLAAEDIQIGLMNENDARQANFDREVERQRQLIDWTKLHGQERIAAEQSFENWKRAAHQRLERQNESSVTKMARDWANLGQNINSVMAHALDGFVDAMVDGGTNFAKFAANIVKELIKIILKAMIAYAIMSALGLTHNASGGNVSLGSFLKGQVGAGFGGTQDPGSAIGYGAGGANVGTNHTGGLMGTGAPALVHPSVFAAAKLYHDGGYIGGRKLRPGEVPIIGMKDELVLTGQQQDILAARMGSNTPVIPPVNVNVINNSATKLSAEQGDQEFNGKEFIVNVVVEEAQKQGPLRDTLSEIGRNG